MGGAQSHGPVWMGKARSYQLYPLQFRKEWFWIFFVILGSSVSWRVHLSHGRFVVRKKWSENILLIFRREQVAWAKGTDNLSGFCYVSEIWLKYRVCFPPLPLFCVFVLFGLFCCFVGRQRETAHIKLDRSSCRFWLSQCHCPNLPLSLSAASSLNAFSFSPLWTYS